jgi:hypothetical protein
MAFVEIVIGQFFESIDIFPQTLIERSRSSECSRDWGFSSDGDPVEPKNDTEKEVLYDRISCSDLLSEVHQIGLIRWQVPGVDEWVAGIRLNIDNTVNSDFFYDISYTVNNSESLRRLIDEVALQLRDLGLPYQDVRIFAVGDEGM